MPERKHTPRQSDETLRARSSSVQRKSRRPIQRKSSLRFDCGEARMLPLHASRMVHPSGARRRRTAGPEQHRQGQGQGAAPGQRDPEEGVGLFCPSGARPPVPQMIAFIEEHRKVCGVEPTCRVLVIAPSTNYSHAAFARDPGEASDQSRRDAETTGPIKRVHDRSKGRCRARKVWQQLRWEESRTVRCTLERLMRKRGMKGVSRGRKIAAPPVRRDPAPKIRSNEPSRPMPPTSYGSPTPRTCKRQR